MKQIVQDLKSGKTILEDVPAPLPQKGEVLIKTNCSLVSLGTEKMLVDFGKANYFQKARQQPERVKQVLQKIKSDGLTPTLDAVFRKLGQPLPLGYCNAGVVIGLGENVSSFKVGDRVVSNGHHAEVVSIPENLVAKIPAGVAFEEAVFTVIGSIALQGIRLINPTFGETVVVTGLGLIGLLASQLLLANGCHVIGLDIDDDKINLAKSWGISAYNVGRVNSVNLVNDLTKGVGSDGVLITASSKSNEIIAEAAQMSRKRGRIVLVGVIGLDISRADFYEKELSFQVSCSYGPGRYDREYEQKGMDYPIEFVRWTEKRNFEAVLAALASEKLNVKPLITENIPLDSYDEIYSNMSKQGSIASILSYPDSQNAQNTQIVNYPKIVDSSKAVLGIIGAGNFSSSTLVPGLAKLKANIKYITSSKGLSAASLAKKYKIHQSTTDYHNILNDSEVSGIIITTQHHQHAKQVIESLKAGKHVFVEKPLALKFAELDEIQTVHSQSEKSITVGFNRRFSPFVREAKKMMGDNSNQAINVIATMNAGEIPKDHWTQDMEIGGGRIVGEACHYIDLISFFTDSEVVDVVMNAQGINPSVSTDNASILLRYKNGSQGIINYFSDGNKAYAKERIEIYSQGRNIIIDNFRKLICFGFKSRGFTKSQDKGHNEQFRKWLDMIKNGGAPLIPFTSILNTSKASIACLQSLKNNCWIRV